MFINEDEYFDTIKFNFKDSLNQIENFIKLLELNKDQWIIQICEYDWKHDITGVYLFPKNKKIVDCAERGSFGFERYEIYLDDEESAYIELRNYMWNTEIKVQYSNIRTEEEFYFEWKMNPIFHARNDEDRMDHLKKFCVDIVKE